MAHPAGLWHQMGSAIQARPHEVEHSRVEQELRQGWKLKENWTWICEQFQLAVQGQLSKEERRYFLSFQFKRYVRLLMFDLHYVRESGDRERYNSVVLILLSNYIAIIENGQMTETLLDPLEWLLSAHVSFYKLRIREQTKPKLALQEKEIREMFLKVKHLPESAKKELNHFATSSTDEWYCSGTAFQDRSNPKPPKVRLHEISLVYFVNINVFGALGGFRMLSQKIKTLTAQRASLQQIQLYLLPIVAAASQMTLNNLFFEPFFSGTVDLLFEDLLDRSHVEKVNPREEQESFKKIASGLQDSMKHYLPQEVIKNRVERFNLNIGLKGFGSGSLAMNLKGINMISTKIERARLWKAPEEERGFLQRVGVGGPAAPPRKGKGNPLDPQLLLDWMEEHSVIKLLFSQTSHPEMINQGVNIPVFLAEHGQLNREHLDMLWDTAIGKHESVKNILFECLIQILYKLKSSDVDYLFGRVKKTIDDEKHFVDMEEVNLLYNFSRIAIPEAEGRKWYGLPDLWCIALDDRLDEKINRAGVEQLRRLMRIPLIQSTQRGPMLDAAIKELDGGTKRSLMAMEFMIVLLETYDKKSRMKKIQEFEKKFQVIGSILKCVNSFRANPPDFDLGTRYETKYIEDVIARLKIVEYLVTESDVTLSSSYVNQLWQIVDSPVCPGEETAFWIWMERLASSKSDGQKKESIALDYDTITYIINEKLSKLPTDRFGPSEFRVFMRYFIQVNKRKGGIMKIEGSKQVYATSANLEGLEKLWQLALESKESSVWKEAVRVLNSMYLPMAVDDWPAEKAGALRRQHLDLCVGNLRKAIKDYSVNREGEILKRKAERCLKMIWGLIADFSGATDQSEEIDNTPLTVFVRVGGNLGPGQQSNHVPVGLEAGITTEELKNRVGQAIGVAASKFRLVRHVGNEEKSIPEKGTVRDAGIEDGALLSYNLTKRAHLGAVVKGSVPEPEMKVVPTALPNLTMSLLQIALRGLGLVGFPSEVVKEQKIPPISTKSTKRLVRPHRYRPPENPQHPSNLLATPTNYEVFFELASLRHVGDDAPVGGEDEIQNQVWRVLNMIPLDSNRMKQLLGMPQADLVSFLETENVFDIAYRLLLIEALTTYAQPSLNKDLHAPPTNSRVQGEALKWVTRFIQAKGLHSLVNAFCRLGAEPQSLPHVAALALVQKLIHIYMTKPPTMQGEVIDEQNEEESAWEDLLRGSVDLTEDVMTPSESLTEGVNFSRPFQQIIASLHSIAQLTCSSASQSNSPLSSSPSLSSSPASSSSTPAKSSSDLSSSNHAESKNSVLMETNFEYGRLVGVGDCAKYGTRLLLSIFLIDQSLLRSFLELEPPLPSLPTFLISLLLTSSASEVREEVEASLSVLCSPKPAGSPALQVIQKVLLGSLGMTNKYPDTCEQYFQLLEFILTQQANSMDQPQQDAQSMADVVEQLIGILRAHTTTEGGSPFEDDAANAREEPSLMVVTNPHEPQRPQNPTQNKGKPDEPKRQVDHVLVGVLSLLRAVLVAFPGLQRSVNEKHRLISYVFGPCLFDQPTSEGKTFSDLQMSDEIPKCKTPVSRRAAFSLLLEICRGSPDNCDELLTLLWTQLEQEVNRERRGVRWNFRGEPGRCAVRKVGLQNLGATCYMNSLMQNLFNVPRFRSTILHPPAITNPEAPATLVYQMQRMFANLLLSQKRSFDTTDYVKSIPGYAGEPLDPCVQWDCNEFFNMLFDRLDSCFKDTTRQFVLREEFGGIFCHQLICLGCPHNSSREEPFYTMSVETKNKENLQQGLDLFVEDELLSGENAYYCDKCDKKVDTKKRCAVQTPPTMLVLNLKRFDFDYEKLVNIKLNHRVSFPHTFDLEPYTIAGLARKDGLSLQELEMNPDADWITRKSHVYNLRGIVVHVGTADRGHYYSFCDAGQGKGPWLRFDDTRVSKFDRNDIPAQAFGGEETVRLYDNKAKKFVKATQTRSYNAYLLVYEHADAEERRRSLGQHEMRQSLLSSMSGLDVGLDGPIGNCGGESELEKREEERDDDIGGSIDVEIDVEETSAERGEEEDQKEEEEKEEKKEEADQIEEPTTAVSGEVEEEKKDEQKKEKEKEDPKEEKGITGTPTSETDKNEGSEGKEKEKSEEEEEEEKDNRTPEERLQELCESIHKENQQFNQEKTLFNLDYFGFVLDVLRLPWDWDDKTIRSPPSLKQEKKKKKEKKVEKKGLARGGFGKTRAIYDFSFVDRGTLDLGDKIPRGNAAAAYFFSFFLEVLSRSESRQHFEDWVGRLSSILDSCPAISRAFLAHFASRKRLLNDVLINGHDRVTRMAYCSLFCAALESLSSRERPFYKDEERLLQRQKEEVYSPDFEEEKEKKGEDKKKGERKSEKKSEFGALPSIIGAHSSLSVWFIIEIVGLLPELKYKRTSPTIVQYLQLLIRFAKLGVPEKRLLIHQGIIPSLVNFYLEQGEFARSYAASPGFTSVGGKTTAFVPNIDHLSSLIELIADLVVGAEHPDKRKKKKKEEEERDEEEGDEKVRLTSFDLDSLLQKKFMSTVIKDNIGKEHVERWMIYWISNSKQYSKFFINILKSGIAEPQSAFPHMRLLEKLQDHVDSLQYWRVDLSLLHCVLVVRLASVPIAKEMKIFISKREKANPLVQKWLERNVSIISEYYWNERLEPPPTTTYMGHY